MEILKFKRDTKSTVKYFGFYVLVCILFSLKIESNLWMRVSAVFSLILFSLAYYLRAFVSQIEVDLKNSKIQIFNGFDLIGLGKGICIDSNNLKYLAFEKRNTLIFEAKSTVVETLVIFIKGRWMPKYVDLYGFSDVENLKFIVNQLFKKMEGPHIRRTRPPE